MKFITISIIVVVILIGGAFLLSSSKSTNNTNIPANNVSIVDGVQIVELKAKGGYKPEVSVAKAGIPTILRFDTSGTFDCSASVRIPSMNISKLLPNTGSTDIDLGIQKVGTFDGTCGMGMYPFQIEFQS